MPTCLPLDLRHAKRDNQACLFSCEQGALLAGSIAVVFNTEQTSFIVSDMLE
jgi:hypothetical protein